MKLNRDLINERIAYIGFNEKPINSAGFCKRINRVKHALLDKGIKKDQLVVICNLSANIDTVATLFAIAELGCVTQFMPWDDAGHGDSDGMGNVDFFLKPEDYTTQSGRDTSEPEFRVSDMLTEVSSGFRKGQAYGGAGDKYHFAEGAFGREVILTNFSEFEDYPDGDIDPPWEVNEDDAFLLLGTKGEIVEVTQKEIVQKAQDCIDIFGYRNKKVGITKSQHHQNSFELCILPAMMSARRCFELPMPDRIMYNEPNPMVITFMDRLRDACTALMKRHGVDLIWGVDDEYHVEGLNYIISHGNNYMDISSRPSCTIRSFENFTEGHVSPTTLTKEVFKDILDTTKAQSIFEIGFNQGHSARLFLDFGKKVHSVDIGYFASTTQKMRETAEEYSNFSSELRDSKTLEPSDYSDVDLMFIDGDHTVEGLSSDMEFADKMEVPYILVDDYDESMPDVVRYVDYITGKIPYVVVKTYSYDAQGRDSDEIIPNTMILLRRC